MPTPTAGSEAPSRTDMMDLKGAAESFGKAIKLDPKHGFCRKMLECVLTAMDDL